jgi:phosphopantetheinyl transferase
VDTWPAGEAAPHISIAHAGDQAIALANAAPVGIDIERVAPRDDHFLAGFSSAAERQRLTAYAGAERDAWITRLWCAKEAFGKRLGQGVPAARDVEARQVGADGSLRMRHRPSGAESDVMTMVDGDFIIAVDSGTVVDPTKELS